MVEGIPGGFVSGYYEELSLNGLTGFYAGLWGGRPAVAAWLRPSGVSGVESMPSADVVSQWAGLVEGFWRLHRDWSSADGVKAVDSIESGGVYYLVAVLEDPSSAGALLAAARERLACLRPPHNIEEIVYGNTRVSREEAITALFQAANSLVVDVLFLLDELEESGDPPARGLEDAGFTPLDDFHDVAWEVHEVSRTTLYRSWKP